MNYLPWPNTKLKIRNHLKNIDERMLNCSEKFIRLQVKKPVNQLISTKKPFLLSSPQSKWFDIYSIFNANQQLNEACNKLWAGIEIMNATDNKVWKKKYEPVGTKFHGSFVLGTAIPTIYYAQLSTIVSIMSIFGCIPIMLNYKRYYIIRTKDGWQLFPRVEYLQNKLKTSSRSWHEVILKTFTGFKNNGIKLPIINLDKTFALKNLRNEMHYEILGDLRMWRAYSQRQSFFKVIPLVMKSIATSIKTIEYIKKITTGCDERFVDLKKNFKS